MRGARVSQKSRSADVLLERIREKGWYLRNHVFGGAASANASASASARAAGGTSECRISERVSQNAGRKGERELGERTLAYRNASIRKMALALWRSGRFGIPF